MISFYYPDEKFPSVSVTGERCALSCPHCEGRFLKGMEHVSDPEELYEFALDLDRSGGEGFLLSGGFNEKGRVPLHSFFDILPDIKKSTSLEINVHTGVPDQEMVEGIIRADVDVVSYDMIGSQETIDTVYGIDLTPKDYERGYDRLEKENVEVVPHVTVGLKRGELDGEFEAIDMLKSPNRLILNSLIPGDFGRRVKNEDFLSVMDHVDKKTDVILGCMRERGREDLEIEALKRGAKGIVLPSKSTRDWVEENHEFRRLKKCCAFH